MAKKIKKDFDKEKMYRKIMPSAASTDRPAREEPPEEEPEEASSADLQVHNYMEDMVRDKLEHTMKVLEACDCPRCRRDVAAMALNALPCAYAVVEDSPRYIKKLRGTYEVKVTSAIIKAIQEVKKNPRH